MRIVRLIDTRTARLSLTAFALVACGGDDHTNSIEPLREAGAPRDASPESGASLPESSVTHEGGTRTEASVDSAKPVDLCRPADSSELLRARAPVMTAQVDSEPEAIFVRDLFNRFNTQCGSCHVERQSGALQVNAQTFLTIDTEEVLRRVTSNNPDEYMPPNVYGGMPFSEREQNDPVRLLASMVQAWVDKGKPPDVFYVDSTDDSNAETPYQFTEEVGTQMTNIGHCIPDATIVGIETNRMETLDELFSDVTSFDDFPKVLEETDLFTLNTETLARHGVIAFAPAYPLFSDHANKIRYIRPPVGTSVRFNPETREFDIPENTRFYKTFLKRVIDEEGHESYRKIETRLILSRPDAVDGDGKRELRALFATYLWNEGETRAELVEDQYRDGTKFADHLLTYITDEPEAKAVEASHPRNLEASLFEKRLIRTYAIPGKDRCEQCHMGSASQAGILGFTPLQVHRRPDGEGGVYEPSGVDELTQLERLIEYKLITGIAKGDGGADAVRLETSQGERKPRNEHELNAQAYMVGNCGFCHNPEGYPSRQFPVLADVLDFWPDQEGGIFQFPLERFSPRIRRGANLDIPIPYIVSDMPDQPREAGSTAPQYGIRAPWRSLIYRNVDSPFTYSDDYAIFPHMPMNVPGFDCRLPALMARWMLSIPSKRKRNSIQMPCDDLTIAPNGLLTIDIRDHEPHLIDFPKASQCFAGSDLLPKHLAETEPQPYVEVKPGDEGYDTALAQAERRLPLYRSGDRYRYYCPIDKDIVDPDVRLGIEIVPQDKPWLYRAEAETLHAWPQDGIPDRPHWAPTDTTETPGDWEPRRNDWQKALIEQDIGQPASNAEHDLRKWEREKGVLAMLADAGRTVTDEFRRFALEPRPMTLWSGDGCDYSREMSAADYGTDRPEWFAHAQPSNDARVYAMAPGEYVFTQICQNCHGERADSRGRLADKVIELTGGKTRVANFRAGLFGPEGNPGQNRARIFGDTATDLGITVDDFASRYLAYMGLGGTRARIPESLLTLVAGTNVFAFERPEVPKVTSANMLSTVQLLCGLVLPYRDGIASTPSFDIMSSTWSRVSLLEPERFFVKETGDKELWPALCSWDNPTPLRVITAFVRDDGQPPAFDMVPGSTFYARSAFASGFPPENPEPHPIGGANGAVLADGISDDNTFPWCILDPGDEQRPVLQAYWDEARSEVPLPWCPPAAALEQHPFDAQAWVDRGAANAGFAVFAFLDALMRGEVEKQALYNECPVP